MSLRTQGKGKDLRTPFPPCCVQKSCPIQHPGAGGLRWHKQEFPGCTSQAQWPEPIQQAKLQINCPSREWTNALKDKRGPTLCSEMPVAAVHSCIHSFVAHRFASQSSEMEHKVKWNLRDYHSVVHIHNGVLLSHEKEYMWISSNEVDETGADYTEWNKPERKTPIQYTNAYIWNIERWYWWTYLQGSNVDV